ncbi:MAG: SH3 domain-containing protein [Desulfatirhabdiaceae bacterium]|nr:SH3 domain-containing protein [Desulfatirhabdiaceae bacterium]
MKIKSLWFCGAMVFLLLCGAAQAEQRVSVSVPEANIRSGSGNNFEVLWKSEKYFPLAVIKKNGDWYQVKDFEGDQGWVHQSLVGNTPSVITIKDKCNLRSEPKPDAKVLFSVGPGIPFKVLKRSNKWILVEHADGDKGWIHESTVW